MQATRIPQLIEAIAAWAARRPDVRAALLVGSRARVDVPADEWSDVDIALFVDDPAPYLEDPDWPNAFGEILVTYVEPTAVGAFSERRALFADGTDVDFAVLPASVAADIAADPAMAQVVRRGHRLLHDELDLASLLARTPSVPPPSAPDEADLLATFWYQAIWAANKLQRGEAWAARGAVEGAMKAIVLELARARAGDAWHSTRFAERWAPETVDRLWAATADGPGDVGRALRLLADEAERFAPASPGVRALLEAILDGQLPPAD